MYYILIRIYIKVIFQLSLQITYIHMTHIFTLYSRSHFYHGSPSQGLHRFIMTHYIYYNIILYKKKHKYTVYMLYTFSRESL